MILVNDPRLHIVLTELPINLIPILPYYVDAVRKFSANLSIESLTDEILDSRMSGFSLEVPAVIYPLIGVDPFLKRQEHELYHSMNSERNNDIYEGVKTFVTALKNSSIFEQPLLNEINEHIPRNPLMIQFVNPFSFLISRRL